MTLARWNLFWFSLAAALIIVGYRVAYDHGKIAGWHECNAVWKAAP